ncbi:Gfo/Idh/MocA family oxidoreductase [Saprospiraceae bacterium]|nr:Gfo/Idh/MocA family oxidoreductase [Saprospiraceae bacterium]
MSDYLNNSDIWLIGTGYMGKAYAKILSELSLSYIPVGRSEQSCKEFEDEVGIKAIEGGFLKWMDGRPKIPSFAIVAVNLDQLAEVTKLLIEYGVKNILVEKPAALNYSEISKLEELSKKYGSSVYVAYNRRFYASSLKALDIIRDEGGVSSFNFEFTEWSHKIVKLDKPKADLENWFLANSSHVVDMAFFLGGKPKKLFSLVEGSTEWYSKGSKFTGCGVTEDNALFNYSANWKSPGRWAVEILTDNYRLIFKPLEKLQIQKLGSIKIEYDESINYDFDEKFKPGLYEQVKAFLNLDSPYVGNLVKIQEHNLNCQNIYKKIENI